MFDRWCTGWSGEPIFNCSQRGVILEFLELLWNRPQFHASVTMSPKAALSIKAWLPDSHSKLEFTPTFQRHNVRRVESHTPHGAERRRAACRKVRSLWCVCARQAARVSLWAALPKPPASLQAPSRNAGPARGGSEPQSVSSPLRHPDRATVAITTTC